MSGTFPVDPGPATVTLDSHQPTSFSRSVSGKGQGVIFGGHLWRAKFTWSKMTRDMLAPIFAFANKQRGRLGSFQIVLPNYATPLGVATGSPKVVGAHSAGASSVSIDGFTASITGIMKGNDILKFANHSKVYMADIDGDSDGSGAVTLQLTPPLIADLSDNEVVTVNDVPFTMSFDDDLASWKGSAPNLVVLSADMTERL